MASNMTTIGFEATTMEDFEALAERVRREGRAVPAPLGGYRVWPDGPEQVWVSLRADGRVAGLNPHFEGTARIRVAVVAVTRDERFPMDGSVSAWADPDSNEPESGQYPFRVDLPDFDAAVDGLELPWFGELQVAMFARGLTCWPDDAAYEAAERDRWGERPGTDRRQVKGFAAESFIPTGSFALPGKDEEWAGPTAEALFTGHVRSSELRANAATGRAFRHLVVRTLGGEYDVVADPQVVDGSPVEGGVVRASGWLSGRRLG